MEYQMLVNGVVFKYTGSYVLPFCVFFSGRDGQVFGSVVLSNSEFSKHQPQDL